MSQAALGSAVVVLRRLAPSDLAAFQAYRADPVLGQYQGWTPKSDAEALAFLTEMSTAALLQPGAWTQLGIALTGDPTLIGDVGLFVADGGDEAQVGFTLRRDLHGRGIATAAVREAIRLVFELTTVDRVVGITDARNLPSIGLLERVGMCQVGSQGAVFRGEPCVEHIYAIARS